MQNLHFGEARFAASSGDAELAARALAIRWPRIQSRSAWAGELQRATAQ
jgi:hypothetical protein